MNKLLISLILVCFTFETCTSASIDGCQYCSDGINFMFEELKNDIKENEDIYHFYLINLFCTEEDNLTNCAANIINWWVEISTVIFSPKTANFVCAEMNSTCHELRYSDILYFHPFLKKI